jgi:3-oxoacyl-[acyl-carrier-protein] synthase-3
MKSVGVIGIGRYLPDHVMTNHDIQAMGLDTSDEWIRERTGIEERRIAAVDQATSDLAYHASVQALESAGITADDLDLIIVATSTPDYFLFPSTACIVQHRLGCTRPIPAFDMSAACTGFNYALSAGAQYVASGAAKKVLVVAADLLSKFLDWTDRSTCILFGDGAGAVVLGEVDPGLGIIASDLFSRGELAEILYAKEGGSRNPISIDNPTRPLVIMEGRAVFKVAVNTVVPAVESVLAANQIAVSDVKLLVFHQANLRIIDAACERLGFTPDQVVITLPKYGNTSASSIPIALCEAVSEGRLSRGDLVVLVGFGAGFTWGVTLLRWSC